MGLQDQPGYQEWIARRLKRNELVRGDHEKGKEITECDSCGIAFSERQFIGDVCIECLAYDFGAADTHRRIAESARGIAAALSSPESAQALIFHALNHMDDLLSDVEDLRDAT